MIKLPRKPKFYIRVDVKDDMFFSDIAKEVFFKRYGGEKKYRDGRNSHFAAKKAGIIHRSLCKGDTDVGYSTFLCPLDYGREMEECVREALDIYCEHRKDRPYVRTEIKGHRKGKCGKKERKTEEGPLQE